MYAKIKLTRLTRELQTVEAQFRSVAARNLTLKSQGAVVDIIRRILREVSQHKQRFGCGAEAELAQLQDLSEAAGGSDADAPAALCQHLPHLSTDCSLLNLERFTETDVAEGKTTTFEAVAALMQANASAGARLAAVLSDASATGAERADAAAALGAFGAALTRLHHQLCIWNRAAYIESCCRRYDGPGSMVEPGIDATDEHWEHVARATQLKREQVFLFIANWDLQERRLKQLRETRARLSADLQAVLGRAVPAAAAGAPPFGVAATALAPGAAMQAPAPSTSIPAPLPALAPVPGASASAAAASVHTDELMDELDALTHSQEAVLMMHAMVDWVIMTDLQRALTHCASFPYPLHAGGIRAAMLRLLVCDADGAFPWAQPPNPAAPAAAQEEGVR